MSLVKQSNTRSIVIPMPPVKNNVLCIISATLSTISYIPWLPFLAVLYSVTTIFAVILWLFLCTVCPLSCIATVYNTVAAYSELLLTICSPSSGRFVSYLNAMSLYLAPCVRTLYFMSTSTVTSEKGASARNKKIVRHSQTTFMY